MSDIHVLEGTLRDIHKGIEMGSIEVTYHVPLAEIGKLNPSFVSRVENITTEEADLIKAGNMLEVVESVEYTSTTPTVEYQNRLKNRWNYLKIAENKKNEFRKQYYLVQFNV